MEIKAPRRAAATGHAGRSVAWHLATFAAALALPILGFLGLLLWQFAAAERARLEAEALDWAKAARVAVDRELGGLGASLQVLSLSRILRDGDLAEFHAQATELHDRLGFHTVLRDAAGQQLVNTRVAFDQPLPTSPPAILPPEGWGAGQPGVSDLFSGQMSGLPVFAVEMPVRRAGTNAPDLISLRVPAERIAGVLRSQDLPRGWTLAVVDGSGTILARRERHEEFVGRQATRDLLESASGTVGTWRGTNIEGTAVFGAYARSALAGWRIAVGAPEAVLAAPLRRLAWILAGAGAGVLLLSALLAFAFGRRIAEPLRALAGRATALGRGEEVVPLATDIREAAVVGETLSSAALLLRERERALRQLNAALEDRVAERTRGLEEANAKLLAEAAERERAQAQLRQSQKMEAVGRLTGGVAHDFNNLLTVVIGNLSLAARRLEEGRTERALAAISGAGEGARRAAQLTQRLLAFSRQQPLAPEPVDVNRLVGGMSELLRRTLPADIQVETVLAGGLWPAQADANQLESAILNLAVNARDAMPGGGRLTIETANAWLDETYAAAREEVRQGQYVMISVSDTGSGMPAEVVAKAFDPFFTTKPVGKGTGLGLSQVYGFTKQSGGHAAIYSEPGEGTTVKLYIPRLQRDAATTPRKPEPPAAPAPSPAGRGEAILVVEDDEMVRDFACAALQEAGYRPLAAADGPGALALLEEHPDIVLLFTDVVLTGPMNGRAVAEAAVARRPDLAVLYTTGYTRNAIIHHGRLDDGVELLGKPYTAAALAEKLHQLLARNPMAGR